MILLIFLQIFTLIIPIGLLLFKVIIQLFYFKNSKNADLVIENYIN